MTDFSVGSEQASTSIRNFVLAELTGSKIVPSDRQWAEWLAARGLPPTRGITGAERIKQLAYHQEMEAAHWASSVWRAWYMGLTARSEGPVQHREDEAAGTDVACDLARRYLSDPIQAVSFVKFQTTYISAKMLDQSDGDLPVWKAVGEIRHEGVLGPGWIYKRCSALMARPLAGASWGARRKQIGLALDILMSKTGMPRVGQSFVDAALLDHFKNITTRRRRSPDAEPHRDQVRGMIDAVVAKVFGGTSFQPQHYIPSLNGAYAAGRKMGGCCGDLISRFACDRARGCGSVHHRLWIHDGGVEREHDLEVVGEDILTSFQEFVDHDVETILDRGFVSVSSCPIIEPNKVRVITKQDASITLRALELQKFMHKAMRCVEPFRLMGEPCKEQFWYRHFNRPLKEIEEYWSGDYKASTDNLDPELSAYAWSAICQTAKIGSTGRTIWEDCFQGYSRWAEIGWADLVGHKLVCNLGKDSNGRKRDPLEDFQRWGQLMGSPCSFPILCLVNACATAVGLGLSCEQLLADDGPIVVNGDDLACIGQKDLYQRWKDVVTAVGLEPSLGKNYRSRYFLMINSEMRAARSVIGPLREGAVAPTVFWEEIGYLNQALLRGFEKKGMDSGKDLKPEMQWTELGERARQLINGIDPDLSKRWCDWFVAIHRDILRGVPVGVGWYVSRHLGGVGLPWHGEAMTAGNLIAAARVACLSERKRAQAVQWPTRQGKSLLDEWLAQSEKHYAKGLPSHWSDRDEFDLILEDWGFPVMREKSDIGSALRLAFILEKACRYFERLESSQVRWNISLNENVDCTQGLAERPVPPLNSFQADDADILFDHLSCSRDRYLDAAKSSCPLSGIPIRNADGTEGEELPLLGQARPLPPEEFESKSESARRRIGSQNTKALRLLGVFEQKSKQLGPDAARRQVIQPMSPERASEWHPPREEIIEYPEVRLPVKRFGHVFERAPSGAKPANLAGAQEYELVDVCTPAWRWLAGDRRHPLTFKMLTGVDLLLGQPVVYGLGKYVGTERLSVDARSARLHRRPTVEELEVEWHERRCLRFGPQLRDDPQELDGPTLEGDIFSDLACSRYWAAWMSS